MTTDDYIFCSKCENNPCKCRKSILVKFEEQFGYCFHIGVETDNITKENIKAFIQESEDQWEQAVQYNVDEDTWNRIKNALITLRK